MKTSPEEAKGASVIMSTDDDQILEIKMAYVDNLNKEEQQPSPPTTHTMNSGRVLKLSLILLALAAAFFVLYQSGFSKGSLRLLRLPCSFLASNDYLRSPQQGEEALLKILKSASMPNNTIIMTAINEAWSAPNSIFDLFLESFKIGNGTSSLLKHVVVVALDPKAYYRCIAVHPHCYFLQVDGNKFSGDAYFMTPIYLEMMWIRIEFLQTILQHGYNFVFTDVDIMWFRNPFPHFHQDADFQISCDRFNGNPSDRNNPPNGGFNYVISNNRTIEFYRYWLVSRKLYPGLHDQDVINHIKFDSYLQEIGLKMRFLDTVYFGGFCQTSKDLNKVCTMHANCCTGLDRKIHDINILLQDWKTFVSLPSSDKVSKPFRWRVPNKCKVF